LGLRRRNYQKRNTYMKFALQCILKYYDFKEKVG
jgi:hypothetical protein